MVVTSDTLMGSLRSYMIGCRVSYLLFADIVLNNLTQQSLAAQ